jgi:ankyrin repeat protein
MLFVLVHTQGVDVNAMANSGGTALMFAAVAGHLDTCKVMQ